METKSDIEREKIGGVLLRVCPMGKPRMTQRDRWKQRPAVLRYHAFKDLLRIRLAEFPKMKQAIDGGSVVCLSWTVWFPMPESWTKKKREAYAGTLHRAKPDRDNIDKAILDALFKDDSGVAGGTLVKRWDDGGGPRIVLAVETV